VATAATPAARSGIARVRGAVIYKEEAAAWAAALACDACCISAPVLLVSAVCGIQHHLYAVLPRSAPRAWSSLPRAQLCLQLTASMRSALFEPLHPLHAAAAARAIGRRATPHLHAPVYYLPTAAPAHRVCARGMARLPAGGRRMPASMATPAMPRSCRCNNAPALHAACRISLHPNAQQTRRHYSASCCHGVLHSCLCRRMRNIRAEKKVTGWQHARHAAARRTPVPALLVLP